MDSNKNRTRQDDHNLKQAAGWMRLWSDEITISGRDGDQMWNFKRSEIDRIFIISVCDSRDNDCLYKVTKDIPGATSAISVTSRFLLHFLQYYPNTFDFVDFIYSLNEIKEISEKAATEAFENLYHSMFRRGIDTVDQQINFQNGPMFEAAMDTVKMMKEEIYLKDIPPIDLSFLDVAWISGVIFASHIHIEKIFSESGQLSYGWGKICIRGRNICILVTASLLRSAEIIEKFLKNEESDNCLYLFKFGRLPDFPDTWMHTLGHALKPDSRGENLRL